MKLRNTLFSPDKSSNCILEMLSDMSSNTNASIVFHDYKSEDTIELDGVIRFYDGIRLINDKYTRLLYISFDSDKVKLCPELIKSIDIKKGNNTFSINVEARLTQLLNTDFSHRIIYCTGDLKDE